MKPAATESAPGFAVVEVNVFALLFSTHAEYTKNRWKKKL